MAAEVTQQHALTLGGGEPGDQGQQFAAELALLDERQRLALRAGDQTRLLKGERWATLAPGHAVTVLEHDLAQPGREGSWRPQGREVERGLQKDFLGHILSKLNIAEPRVGVGDHHAPVVGNQLRLIRKQLLALRKEMADPELRERLDDVIAGEESIEAALRLVCDQLKPTGYDDPLGLALSLRQELKWTRTKWRVPATLQLDGEAVPLTRPIHRALVKITHEAMNNAVVHGKPEIIVVRVCYPGNETQPLILTVTNDGRPPSQPVAAKRGHWGVRNMREYAEAVGGTTQGAYPEIGGTQVIVALPPAVVARAVQEAVARLREVEAGEQGESEGLAEMSRTERVAADVPARGETTA